MATKGEIEIYNDMKSCVYSGDIESLMQINAEMACGCMGARDGETLCPCMLRHATFKKYLKSIDFENGTAILSPLEEGY